MSDILYLDKIASSDRAAFEKKLIIMSDKLQAKPNWFTIVFNSESGLNPKAYNKSGGASGIFQAMPSTAKSLGTTTDALRNMKASEQLDYAYKYFSPYAGKMKSAYDVYLVTFFPIAVGKPDDWVFEAKNLSRSAIAKGNPAIDLNKDNQITIGEFKQWFAKRTGQEYANEKSPTAVVANTVKKTIDVVKRNKLKVVLIGSGIVLALGTAFYFVLTKKK